MKSFKILVLAISGWSLGCGVAYGQAEHANYYSTSELGVHLRTGNFVTSSTDVTIGTAGNGLSFSRSYDSSNGYVGPLGIGWVMDLEILGIKSGSGTSTMFSFNIGTSIQAFTVDPSDTTKWESERGDGSYIIGSTSGSPSTLTYYSSDGTKMEFAHSAVTGRSCFASASADCNYELIRITKPNNETLDFAYHTYSIGQRRLMSVTSSLAWNLSFAYEALDRRLYSVQATNLAEMYCANSYGGQPHCNAPSGDWDRAIFVYGNGNTEVATVYHEAATGLRVEYGYDSSSQLKTIRNSSSGPFDLENTYGTSTNAGQVIEQKVRASYTPDGGGATTTKTGIWTYGYYSGFITWLTDPDGDRTTITYGSNQKPVSVIDAEGHGTYYQYDTHDRVTRVTAQESNYTQYTYDARGNITEVRQAAKPGSGLADIVTTAAYPSSCSIAEAKRCNKPVWTRDALSNQTDYVYDIDHGGVLSATSPAQPNGVRPRTNLEYIQHTAYSWSPTGWIQYSPVYRLKRAKSCQTLSNCSGQSDEIVTRLDYGVSSYAGKNRLLSAEVSDEGGLNYSASFTYDQYGNLITVDGPYAGSNDVTRNYYDGVNGRLQRSIGSVGPDPDLTGPLWRPTKRISYDSTGRVDTTEIGAASSQPGTHPGIVALHTRDYHYDSLGRVISSRIRAGGPAGSTLAAAQTSFNTDGSVECVNQRMNLSALNGTHGINCTLSGAGSFGSDRVTKTAFDDLNRPLRVIEAADTPVQRIGVTFAYTDNGQIRTVRDPRGGLTTYEYDGHDRLKKISYPSPTTQLMSSTTDYETFTYNARGQRLTWKRRDGQTIAYTYDNLGRVTKMDTPGGTALDVYYTYDNLGRVLSMTHGSSTSSDKVAYTYDKLSRPLTETTSNSSFSRTVSYFYLYEGRLVRMTWPDGFFVDYKNDYLGRVIEVRENGATSGVGLIAKYTYDNNGRRTRIDRSNGADTTYAYDSLGRLTQLVNGMNGTAYDVRETFTYSPASQIVSHDYDNPDPSQNASTDVTYKWSPSTTNDTRYNTYDYQNKITNADGSTVTSDARGNVTSVGSDSYQFDVLNRLTQATVNGQTTTFTYDPVGRLQNLNEPTPGSNDMLYSGQNLIAEYDGSALIRRYVPGPGADEWVSWYDGPGIANREFFHQNAQGSVVAVTNSSGTMQETYNYDPYGKPSSTVGVRFKYTGQMLLAGAGLYHYKARAYSPTLGRFLQADPIGYGDGLNMYAYVGGDPVNMIDPSGRNTYRLSVTLDGYLGWGGGVDGGVFITFGNGHPFDLGLFTEMRGGGGFDLSAGIEAGVLYGPSDALNGITENINLGASVAGVGGSYTAVFAFNADGTKYLVGDSVALEGGPPILLTGSITRARGERLGFVSDIIRPAWRWIRGLIGNRPGRPRVTIIDNPTATNDQMVGGTGFDETNEIDQFIGSNLFTDGQLGAFSGVPFIYNFGGISTGRIQDPPFTPPPGPQTPT